MGKFNVGDRVEIVRYEGGAPKGEIVTVSGLDQDDDLYYSHNGQDDWWAASDAVKPAPPSDPDHYYLSAAILTPQQAVNLASKLLQFATQARE